MASSLPDDAGRRTSKPVKKCSSTVSKGATFDSYGSEDTLNWRKRATTVTDPRSLLDRRSQPQGPCSVPHRLKIDCNTADFSIDHFIAHTQPAPNNSSVLDYCPSAPIAIPSRNSQSSVPTTPLTGREPSFSFLRSPKTSNTSSKHNHSNSNGSTSSPDSTSQSSRTGSSGHSRPAHSPVGQRTMKAQQGGASPLYTPSSPLSPTMLVRANPPLTGQNTRPKSHHQYSRGQPAPLAIPTLPPFHPANYESRTPSPRNTTRPFSPTQGRQLSDAQRKLQRFQRDIVINASRATGRTPAKSPMPRPTSPRLDPLGSPGPVTPLMLEGQGDYFLAGSSTASASALKDGERRELAERMMAAERDRIAHPERAERHSPAVSPAGGRG